MLTLDPDVKRFVAQPFKVDLIDGRICRTDEEVAEVRARHRQRQGPVFYTPDFLLERLDKTRAVLEVKLENYLGDDRYSSKLARSQEVLEALGYRFYHVVVPVQPRHPLRTNLVLLNKAALRPNLWPSLDEAELIASTCGEEDIELGVLSRRLGLSPDMAPYWLASGVLRANLFLDAINFELHVTPAYGDLSHLAFLPGITR